MSISNWILCFAEITCLVKICAFYQIDEVLIVANLNCGQNLGGILIIRCLVNSCFYLKIRPHPLHPNQYNFIIYKYLKMAKI